MLFLFAGPVISNTDYSLILTVAFLVIVVVLAAVLFFVKRLLNKNKSLAKKLSIEKSFLIATSTLAAGILMFLVIPTILSDHRWDNKQADCAIQAGYTSPSDNESSKATPVSQKLYKECLNAE
jgi:heme/copper-type cytochrome/quinol oxidase subunit 2